MIDRLGDLQLGKQRTTLRTAPRMMARRAQREVRRGTVCRLLTGLLFLTSGIDSSAQERVISTDAAITSLVLALGAGDRLVGVDVTSSLPSNHGKVARVGYHRALSAEGLLSLNPDLLLLSEHAGPKEVVDKLQSIGVGLTRVPAALDAAQLSHNIVTIADALGAQAAGVPLIARVETLSQNLAGSRLSAPRTLLIREREGALRVAGAETAGGALISLIGGANMAEFDGYRSFSEEALMAMNPELLLVAVSDAQRNAGPQVWLQDHPLMQHMQAISENAWALVPAEVLVGGLSLAALREAEALLTRFGNSRVASQ